MKILVTTTREYEIVETDGVDEKEPTNIEDVRDSFLSTLNDEESSGFETSDEKFMYTPGALIHFTLEENK